MSDINAWRAQERESLYEVLDQLEHIGSLPRAERTAPVEDLRQILAAGVQQKGECLSIKLATDWIELDLAEANASFHAERFKRWRREAGYKTSKPGLETDALVIQLHLKRLHGAEVLMKDLRNPIPERLPIRWLDRVHTDWLSLELMIKDAWKIDESLYLPDGADLEAKVALAEQLIVKARHLSQFEGLTLEGNEILINRTLASVTFNYRWVTIEKEVPDVIAAGLAGRPLSSAVGGQGDVFDAVTIAKATRHETAGKHKLTLETDRLHARNMITLNPSRWLEETKEPGD